jgi:mannose-6-phosphate isomerase-like protein (cupin superfamily)
MAERQFRRVVTGINEQGESTVIIDEAVSGLGEMPAVVLWRSNFPADNSGNADTAVPFTPEIIHSGQVLFNLCQFPARMPPVMHATDALDFLIVVSGRLTLVTENGEAHCGPGDCIVDRGVLHGWSNPHDEPCVVACVTLPAAPVGKGRTM